MNIAIFTDSYYPEVNGVSVSVDLQRKILRSKGHRVFVIAPGLKGQNEITFEDDIMRIPTVSLTFVYTYHMGIRYSNKANKILKSLSLDIIHTEGEFGISTFGRHLAAKLNIPLVYTFHSAYGEYLDYVSKQFRLIKNFNSRLISRLIKTMCSRADEIIVPNKQAFEKMRNNHIDRHISVIPNPISFSSYDEEYGKEMKKKFIADYHLEGKKLLLYIGTVTPEKELNGLISDFEKYADSVGKDKAALIIVGEGASRKELENNVREDLKDSVVFTGMIPHEEIPFYYRLADVFVSASTGETQGRSFTEAAEHEVPLLAKFDFHLADFIEDGRTGFFYNDTEGFIRGLEKIFSMDEEEKKEMLSLSKEKLSAGNSEDEFYGSLIHVYKKAQRKYF